MYQGIDHTPTDTAGWQRKFARKFEPKEQYLIPLLQYVQSEEGYLPPEAIQAVAEFLRVPQSKVFGVASFYAQFHFEPRGRNTVTICRGTACHVRGSAALLRDVERQLGVKAGETTPDLKFSLETVACFGSCALAPVVVINDRVSGRVTPERLRALVAETDAADTGSAPKKRTPSKRSPKSSARKRAAAKRTSGRKRSARTTRTQAGAKRSRGASSSQPRRKKAS